MGRGKKIVDIELVVDEAIALIEGGGVEEFSTRRLASRLGISAMTLYNYYENREAILKETFRRSLGIMWDGLASKIEDWRSRGGASLAVYRLVADHLLLFATGRPRLCRFVLTQGAGLEWSDRAALIDRIRAQGEDGEARAKAVDRDAYLFELLVFALALKVVAGSESPDRYRDLAREGYDRLLAAHEVAVAQPST